MRINKDYIIKITIEIFSVVFAVLLALWLNERKEAKQHKKLALQAEENIRIELNENLEVLSKAVPRYDSYITRLDSAILTYEQNPQLTKKFNVGASLSVITTVAWETTKTSKAINYIDFDRVMGYSKIYEVHKMYKDELDEYIHDMADKEFNDKNKKVIWKLKRQRKHLSEVQNITKQLNKALQGLRL